MEVQFTTRMGQKHQKECEGRQAEEGGGGRGGAGHHLAQRPQQYRRDIITKEADKCLTDGESFVSWTLYPV